MKVMVIIGIIGLIVIGLANVVGIGYGLYLWGAVGTPLSASVWSAFLLWIKMILGGLVLFIISVFAEK